MNVRPGSRIDVRSVRGGRARRGASRQSRSDGTDGSLAALDLVALADLFEAPNPMGGYSTECRRFSEAISSTAHKQAGAV